MTDLSNQNPNMFSDGKRSQQLTSEYRVYLGLIFLAAVPFCSVIWAYSLIRHMKMPEMGPIQSALSEARTITPRIFWA